MGSIEQFRDPELATDGSVVGFYEREFYVFSNFSSFQVAWRGIAWMTSEHAYQAARFMGACDALVEDVRSARSSHDAFTIARANTEHQRTDWDTVKADTMLDICRHKLQQHEYIQKKLLQTGDTHLVEDSPVDDYWGWGPDRNGRNELGTIWMKLREELLREEL